MADLNLIAESVILGDEESVVNLTRQALDDGVDPEKVLKEGLVAGMDVMGEKMKNYEVFIPDVLESATAMQGGLALVRPLLVSSGIKGLGRVAIGTVRGDIHEIGKNLVRMMMEGAGFEVIDLGTDVEPETFVKTVAEGTSPVDIVCMSALMTTTMPSMKETIDAFEEAGIRHKLKILIGGAPVSGAFAEQIGADGYGRDATDAVRRARELVARSKGEEVAR